MGLALAAFTIPSNLRQNSNHLVIPPVGADSSRSVLPEQVSRMMRLETGVKFSLNAMKAFKEVIRVMCKVVGGIAVRILSCQLQ